MSVTKFSYANDLVECAKVHFAHLYTEDAQTYNQYMVCARFLDTAGNEY